MKTTALEFHRHALARIPSADDRHPGIAFYVQANPVQQFCTCQSSKKKQRQPVKTCKHLKSLSKNVKQHTSKSGRLRFEERFKQSLWHALAVILSQGDHLTPQTVVTTFAKRGDQTEMRVSTQEGALAFVYRSCGEDRNRLADRLGIVSNDGKARIPDRAEVIRRLQLLTLTETERELSRLDRKSRRQALEASLWFRLAYHCFLAFGADGCHFHPSVDEATGAFFLTCKNVKGETIFYANIARNRVRPLLDRLRDHLPNQHDLPIHPIPLKSLFRVSQTTEMDLDVLPVIRLIQAEGEDRFFSREGLEKFVYGDLVYLPELKILAEMEKPGRIRTYVAPKRMTFKRYQIPAFLESVGDALGGEGFVVDPDVEGLALLKHWDSMTMAPSAIDRDWCWLSVAYGFGDESVSLAEILAARRAGNRYIGTPAGWVDTRSPAMESLGALVEALPDERLQRQGAAIQVSPLELFQLAALQKNEPVVAGEGDLAGRLSRLLACEPMAEPPDPGLTSALRDYQSIGLKWLWWLWENGFGGLLCDDMGLGKTHQIMALMSSIRHRGKDGQPHLVVCPTTVVNHWERKLEQHAPSLKHVVYYGADRSLTDAMREAHVLVTSYGLLRRDEAALKTIPFSLAVFDEIQQIKNPATKTYAAARNIQAKVKLGLTGTPIENAIVDLKALMDVVLPGYLGADSAFRERFVPVAAADKRAAQNSDHLRRLIYPFTLRRLKDRVLHELPPKIEDLRYCELTDQQVKLYRDAIEARGKSLIQTLSDESETIPYVHIFALLTLLKQICNHPALVGEGPSVDDQPVSGKWELFKELVGESLASGQKVVVYSQFARMVGIIDDYLASHRIGHVVLTGASRRRGELVETFNTDPQCRVFVGSLKAGGTGIDLVAGSVVIHYDRWWNAAKEDQATDRVHRIGQRRGIQVFKLVTLGTLEEKIAAIIEKKRKLMADIVREDDPGLLKSFDRQELLQLLT